MLSSIFSRPRNLTPEENDRLARVLNPLAGMPQTGQRLLLGRCTSPGQTDVSVAAKPARKRPAWARPFWAMRHQRTLERWAEAVLGPVTQKLPRLALSPGEPVVRV